MSPTTSLIVAALAATAIAAVGAVAARGPRSGTDQQVTTQATLDRVEEALVGYVRRNGRLPCPASGAAALTSTAGATAPSPMNGTCPAAAGGAAAGVLPWRSLGLSADDALDAWGRRFSYRVGDGGTASVVGPRGLDFSRCAPPGQSLANVVADLLASDPCERLGRNLSHVLGGAGMDVTLAGGAMTRSVGAGAAYILVSHGPNGRGAWMPGGVAAGAAAQGREAVVALAGSNRASAISIHGRFAGTDGADPFDDVVRVRSAEWVSRRAGLWPRWAPAGPPIDFRNLPSRAGTVVTIANSASVGVNRTALVQLARTADGSIVLALDFGNALNAARRAKITLTARGRPGLTRSFVVDEFTRSIVNLGPINNPSLLEFDVLTQLAVATPGGPGDADGDGFQDSGTAGLGPLLVAPSEPFGTETFEFERGSGLRQNFNDFREWVVTAGAVDLEINQPYLPCRENTGHCVDLAGHTGVAGTLRTRRPTTLRSGTYRLSFWLGGSPRGATDTERVTVRVVNASNNALLARRVIDVPARAQMARYTTFLNVSATTLVHVEFANAQDTNNYIGAVLDDVELRRMPIWFVDRFDEAAPGTASANHTSLANWSVSSGSVDLVAASVGGVPCRGNTGSCLDLSGTVPASPNDSYLRTRGQLTLPSGRYTLSFWLGGSNRGTTNDEAVRVQVVDSATAAVIVQTLVNVPAQAPLTKYHLPFSITAASRGVRLEILNANDGSPGIGAILDEVELRSAELGFEDDFDDEAIGDQPVFSDYRNWRVTGGTTDLHFDRHYAGVRDRSGSGHYVDLAGVTAGTLQMRTGLSVEPGTYYLSYWLASHLRGAPDIERVTVSVLANNVEISRREVSLEVGQGWTPFTDRVTVTSRSNIVVRFVNQTDTHDYFGAFLDDVSFTPRPPPTVFYDSFGAAWGAANPASILNHTGFANWEVTQGSVDLKASDREFAISCRGGDGYCVDLDGTTDAAGTLRTRTPLRLGPGIYTLGYWLGGSQRGETTLEDVRVRVFDGNGMELSRRAFHAAADGAFQRYTQTFTLDAPQTDVHLEFASSQGGTANVGAILDDVELTMVVPTVGAGFIESFDGENGGVAQAAHSGFRQFTTALGAPDLEADATGTTCPGGVGVCVDLGTLGGILRHTLNPSPPLASGGAAHQPGVYRLQAAIGNRGRSVAQTLTTTGVLGSVNGLLGRAERTLPPEAPTETLVRDVTVTGAFQTVQFFNNALGGFDGALLDDVLLVPTYDISCFIDGSTACAHDGAGRGRTLGTAGSVFFADALAPGDGTLTVLGRDANQNVLVQIAYTRTSPGAPPARLFQVVADVTRSVTVPNGQRAILNLGRLTGFSGQIRLLDGATELAQLPPPG